MHTDNIKAKIAYLGPEATNTHQAAMEIFGSSVEYLPLAAISDIFQEVVSNRADFGVVPIENSIQGSINLTLDLLTETDIKITGEKTIMIRHHLIGCGKINEITEVYSHPQVLGQCRNWLRKNCPGVRQIETSSSSSAVQKTKNRKTRAAIGTAFAADLYKCPVIRKNIHDFKSNKTRFFIISRKTVKPGPKNKTSIVFLCHDRPGALVEVLKVFKKFNINLSKIESRPSKRRDWEYYFYVDFLGHESDVIVVRALKNLKKVTIFSKVLGSYPVEQDYV